MRGGRGLVTDGREGREKSERKGREICGIEGREMFGIEGREMSGKDSEISGRGWVRLCGKKSWKAWQGCKIGIQQPR